MPGVVRSGIFAAHRKLAATGCGIYSDVPRFSKAIRRNLVTALCCVVSFSTISCSYFSRRPDAAAGRAIMTFAPEIEAKYKTQNFLASKIEKINPRSNAQKLSKLIVATSEKEEIDPLILASIVKHESTFKGTIHSSKGAAGLMQVMPSTAKYMSRRLGLEWRGRRALLHPEYNLRLGVRYLHYLKKRFRGDTKMALVAYNWGPTNLERSLRRQRPMNSSAVLYANRILALQAAWRQEFNQSHEI